MSWPVTVPVASMMMRVTRACAGSTETSSAAASMRPTTRSEEHTSELQSQFQIVCRLLLEKKKRAQANLIVRREETAAMRSMLNTARLLQENPVLMRLKELETLEKFTEKVDKLTVFGGLEGVMKDVVRIGV